MNDLVFLSIKDENFTRISRITRKTHRFTRVCLPDGNIRATAMYVFAWFARFAWAKNSVRWECFHNVFSLKLLKNRAIDGDHSRICSPTFAQMVATIHVDGRHQSHMNPCKTGKTHDKNVSNEILLISQLMSKYFTRISQISQKAHRFTRACHPDGNIRAIAMYVFAWFARFAWGKKRRKTWRFL